MRPGLQNITGPGLLLGAPLVCRYFSRRRHKRPRIARPVVAVDQHL